MDIKSQVIVSKVDYQCDNCKLANVIYSPPAAKGLLHQCPNCKQFIILSKVYPYIQYD